MKNTTLPQSIGDAVFPNRTAALKYVHQLLISSPARNAEAAAMGNLLEEQLSREAADRAKRDEVKRLAHTLVDEHTKSGLDLQMTAYKAAVDPTTRAW